MIEWFKVKISIVAIIFSFVSIIISFLAYHKDNKISLAMNFVSSYYDKDPKKKVVLIQGYNKSKIGEAFRFKGVFFHNVNLPVYLKKKIY